MPSTAAAAWESILRIHAALLPRLERVVIEQTGTSLAWYDVLLELNTAGGRLTMGELGERVVLSRSRVSRVVDELVDAALVTREPNHDDRRSSFAALTAEGRKRFLEVARVYLAAIDRELGQVPEATLAQVAGGLAELLDADRRR
jgi:DNA-binding MarR family transcriptional regulator